MKRWLIAGVLLLLLVPVVIFSRQQQQFANDRRMREPSNSIQFLGAAVTHYIIDHKGKLPPMQTTQNLQEALTPYTPYNTRTATIFTSPATGRLYEVNASLSARALKTIPRPANVVMLYEAAPISGPNNPNEMFRVVCFANGNVLALPEARWPALKQDSGIR